MQDFSMADKVAIITGGSRGIGLSIAKYYAEAGAKVVISSRKQEGLDKAMEEMGFNSSGKVIAVACNVGSEIDRKNLVEKTIAAFGQIDVLVNNAAANPSFGPISEAEGGVFDKIMDVNVKAPMILSNLCYPYLKETGGSVINISSVEGHKPNQGLGMYSVSKSALIMLTKTQAKEWGKEGVRSNAICPGLIKTKFSSAIWENEAFLNKFVKQIPTRRMGKPSEIAGLAVFLASPAASYCTGGVYIADGGYLLA